MAYEKFKKEQYKNVGGINQKASVYVTGENEVLDLVNYDLQTPGAWTPRWGMTAALAGNTLAVGASNRFNFGFQVYKTEYPGITFSQAAYVQGNSQTYSLSLSSGVLAQSSTLTVSSGFGNVVNVCAGISTSSMSFSNLAYFVSGKGTFKAGTEGIFYYGLPPYGFGAVLAGTISYLPMSATNTGGGTFFGTLCFIFAYEDLYGYVGPGPADISYYDVPTGNRIFISGAAFGSQAAASGATYVRVYTNRVYGYESDLFVAVGRLSLGSTLTLDASSVDATKISSSSVIQDDYQFIAAGESVGNIYYNSRARGADSEFDTNGAFNVGSADVVEFYVNRLFWGLASGKNIVYFSNEIEFIYNAQDVPPENFISLPNSKYPLIGLKAYNQSLMALHQKGITRITGSSLDTFTAVEITDQYGLVCSRACVVFEERMWFLDDNHIVEFNGANTTIVSYRVDHIIARMNLTAAQKTATAYHYEERHEVWFSIPIDGSNENNIILVYDYLADGWTTFKSSSNFTMLQPFYDQTLVQGVTASTVFLNNKKIYASHPGGSMGYFGASFRTDYGQGYTLSFKTRNHAEQGHSTTMEWRRLFLDTGAWGGVTLPFQANFYANFATATISLTRTMYEVGSAYSGPQQTRIDFGIPAKALSAELVSSSTAAFKVYGYTIESRFLRRV